MRYFRIVEKKNLWFALSLGIILAGCVVMVNRALHSQPILNYGIDFVGGNTMILNMKDLNNRHETATDSPETINAQFIQDLRSALSTFDLATSTIQITQNKEVLIKTLHIKSERSQEILDHLQATFGEVEVLEIDFIGPTIGSELKETSIWIILLVSISLLLYISWRFEFKFGLAALFALVHDALISISFSAFLNIEINTAYVAALLTILGYSINDTIIIFDRIRENLALYQESKSIRDIINISLVQTFRRTINTSFTTLAVILCLILFGGTTIKEFCVILFIGILAGTYSSIFIASPIVLQLSSQEQPQLES